MSSACQACGRAALEPFFSMDGVPLSSCALVETRSAATEFGRGDVELAVCRHCGFIQNRRFLAELIDHTMAYEESQAFSPRFAEFQDELVSRLVEEYALKGKTIFEIGSGKGAFLETICRTAKARGLGIDPSGDAGRIDADLDISVIRGTFDETKTALTGDLICCRHTLEHIAPVRVFVRNVATSLEHTPHGVAYFELPDTDRILDEGAFWDIYYEHCSYFTKQSLSHLLRAAGLDIIRLEVGFGGQYILVDAQIGSVNESMDRGAVDDIVARCRRFGHIAARQIESWQLLVDEHRRQRKSLALWGAGSKAVGFLSALGRDDAVSAVVDINPYKQNSFLPGSAHEIVSPEMLRDIEPDLVVVMNPVYLEEIRAMLAELGLHPRLEAVGAMGR